MKALELADPTFSDFGDLLSRISENIKLLVHVKIVFILAVFGEAFCMTRGSFQKKLGTLMRMTNRVGNSKICEASYFYDYINEDVDYDEQVFRVRIIEKYKISEASYFV